MMGALFWCCVLHHSSVYPPTPPTPCRFSSSHFLSCPFGCVRWTDVMTKANWARRRRGNWGSTTIRPRTLHLQQTRTLSHPALWSSTSTWRLRTKPRGPCPRGDTCKSHPLHRKVSQMMAGTGHSRLLREDCALHVLFWLDYIIIPPMHH